MTGIKFFNTELGFRPFLRVAVALFLLAPYLLWLLWIQTWSWPAFTEWGPVLAVAMGQAALSALFSLLLGFILFAAAQAWFSLQLRSWIELALLLPNMIPPLFLVLAILSWVMPWMAFPYGCGAVVAAHVLLNSGLVAVALERLFTTRIGGMVETAWLLGSSRFLFWRRIGWPYLKADLAGIFLFVFTLCFTSFSIPLLLGGEKMATLEVAIYDTIRLEGRWDKAVILAALQTAALALLAGSLPRALWPGSGSRRSLRFLGLRSLRPLVFLPALVLLLGWADGTWWALKASASPEIQWLEPLLTSLALGLSVGILHLLLFLTVAYVLPHAGLDRFLNGYLAASPAITGFALLLCPGGGEALSFLKLSVALTLLSFPLLYRWLVHSALSALHQQVRVARVLGASWAAVLFEVVWPQVAPQVMRASGLAALWACGDFALSGILGSGLNTLPLLMQDLIAGYRIETAQVLMIPLLLAGLGLYGLFVGASRYVVD